MVLETFALALALAGEATPRRALPEAWAGFAAAPMFRPGERAVDNWRRESALNLDIETDKAIALALGRDISGLSRCVRLNNYWCIKRAGWNGEIAADAEGHVAFASAREGAMAAAVLLRRYYVDFGLRTARSIVSRWAPATCGFVAAPAKAGRIAGRTLLGPEPRGLTTRGLGNTLRARWLAAHGRGGVAKAKKSGKPRAIARSVVPDRAPALMRTPTIAAGVGPLEVAPVRLAMLPFPGLALGPAPGPDSRPRAPVCGSDAARIANYAARLAEGVAAGPEADLNLFDGAGRPQPILVRALLNMAAVEIGPLKARASLIEGAVAALPPPAAAAP